MCSKENYCIKKQCRTFIGEKSFINKAIHALLMYGYALFNMLVPGPFLEIINFITGGFISVPVGWILGI